MPAASTSNPTPLRIIAGFKLLEALLLIVAGLGAMGLLDHDVQRQLIGWLDALSLREGRRITSEFASHAIDMLGSTSLHRLVLIAVGCFIYGGVFLIEAVGLWFQKHWAEYLTTIMTASLLPFEVFELLEEVTAARIATLVVNLLVVAYLVRRLWRDAHTKRDEERDETRDEAQDGRPPARPIT